MSTEALCFPRAALPRRSGLVPWRDGGFADRVDAAKEFRDREELERSADHVQVIACAVVGAGDGRYHLFESAPGVSYDTDGHASLIVGGHIERCGPQDETLPLARLARDTLAREMREELGRALPEDARLRGFLVDASSVKNSRHVGLLFECAIEGRVSPVAAEEFRVDSALSGTYTVSQLRGLRHRMDPWSQIYTDSL